MSDLVQRLREYSNWGVSREAASMLSEAADELERLTRELEEARKDQARYRWLRSRVPGGSYRIMGVIYSEGGSGVDAAIDAAMSQEKRKDALDRMARDADELGLDY